MRTAYFPDQWKVATIIMCQKPGKPPNDVKSYRPISLLPVISKLFEKILLIKLKPILVEKKLIPDHQFGFRTNHSTIEQVHRVIDKIATTFEKKEYFSAVFLDIQQAFDRVWHKGLLYKLKKQLPHNYYLLLDSYLKDRIFQIKQQEELSNFHEIKAGVPQGSVLGPVLYTLFTADLPGSKDVTTATYADDTAILASHVNPVEASAMLQVQLNAIQHWLTKWRIRASSAKSNHITFSLRRGDCPTVQLDKQDLPVATSVRYLGIHLDRRLTWVHHIKSKRTELNLRLNELGWLIGRRSSLTTNNKLLVYKSILKPVWTYGLELWETASNSNLEIV